MGPEALMPLALMQPGESGVLSEIRGLRRHPEGGHEETRRHPSRRVRRLHLDTRDKGHRLEHRLHYLGLVPGEPVRVVQNSPAGSVVVAVKDSRLCLGRGVAFRLMIRPDNGG